jgi:universal stress protein A
MDLKSLDAILVPLDFSDTSFGALETALSIAPRERVHLAHVLPVAGGLAWAVGGSAPDAARVEGARHRMQRELTEHGFDPAGHPLHVRVGAPGPEICELADRIGAGLIIIGSHGRGGLEKLILGSVAYDVVRNSRRPVLLERATR